MKRKIFLQILGAVALSLVVLFVAVIVIMYVNGKQMIRERLKVETNLVTELLHEPISYDQAFDEYYDNHELRVTIISTDGNVLYESDDEESEESHLNREEVKNALSGTPKAVERYSKTFQCEMTYYAMTDVLSNGEEIVVRLAVRSSEITSYILPTLPFLILSLVVAVLIASLLANQLSRSVAERIDEVGDSLRSLNAGEYKPLTIEEKEPELYFVFKEINELNESTHRHMLREKEIIQQKSDFFANASHELKTPITVMRGLTEILLSKESLDEQEKKQIARIHKESLRMGSLISDMLKLSNLERGEVEERMEVDLHEIATEVITELSEETKAKNLMVRLEGAGKVFADPKKMFELIQNLCSNAVNYNKQGGLLEGKIMETEDCVKRQVTDSGIGIEKEHIPRLCERFYRVDKSRSKKTGGTGLGLAIVKHICALYHAELSIESEIDKGTCVTVEFKK